VLEEARKAGFARVRADGQVLRLEDVSALDKKKKHTLDIVIDRVTLGTQGKAAERARLADSVETALKAGGGSMLAAVEGEALERHYSEARACPACGVGLPELVPQLFSFNSPLGMCIDCNGLGSSLEIDPDLVVPNPSLSISEGAIEPWGQRLDKDSGWTASIATALKREYGHPARQALEEPDLPPPGDHAVRDRGQAGDGEVGGETRHRSWALRFTGVVNNIKRRMQETQSEAVRQMYGRYFRERECRACAGKRLRPEARAVVMGGKNLADGDVHDGGVGGGALRRPGADRRAGGDRRRDPERGEDPAGLPAERRARLPDAGAGVGDIVRAARPSASGWPRSWDPSCQG
jgi:excinuclease ABC subunit A